jgi:hypothetical protein
MKSLVCELVARASRRAASTVVSTYGTFPEIRNPRPTHYNSRD